MAGRHKFLIATFYLGLQTLVAPGNLIKAKMREVMKAAGARKQRKSEEQRWDEKMAKLSPDDQLDLECWLEKKGGSIAAALQAFQRSRAGMSVCVFDVWVCVYVCE